MATFGLPSHLMRVGQLAPHARKYDRDDPVFGDGLLAKSVLASIDPCLEALVVAGYQPVSAYIHPGEQLPGKTVSFETLDTLEFSIGWSNWHDATGFAAPLERSLTVAVLLQPRDRYAGAGPTFALPLPSLGTTTLFPRQDSPFNSVFYLHTLTENTDRGEILRAVQFDVQTYHATLAPVGLLSPVLSRIAHDFVSLVSDDIAAAAAAAEEASTPEGADTPEDAWYQQPADNPQLGLLPIFNWFQWRYAVPWIEDTNLGIIQDFGSALHSAISSMPVRDLLESQLVDRKPFGELLAAARGLPMPPPTAAETVAALAGRYGAVVRLQRFASNPIVGSDSLDVFRLLMLAHELAVVDVLGTSSAVADEADVANVQASIVDFDVTGRWETQWNWTTSDGAQVAPTRRGMLQLNQVGSAINGHLQVRLWADQVAKQVTSRHYVVQAAHHDVTNPEQPILRFSLDAGSTWSGILEFDFAGGAAPTLRVRWGQVNGSTFTPGDVPQDVPTEPNYAQISTAPYVHEYALESIGEDIRARVEHFERGGLHQFELTQLHAAGLDLVEACQHWKRLTIGQSGGALDANVVVRDALAPYAHPDEAQRLRLMARAYLASLLRTKVTIDNKLRPAAILAGEMVALHPQQTPEVAELLGIDPDLSISATPFTYEWYLSTVGASGDAGPFSAGVGGGAFAGTMWVTKKQGDELIWSQRYSAELAEGSYGASGGVAFSKSTGNSIITTIDVETPEQLVGSFDMWGTEIGGVVGRAGVGDIQFNGNGTLPAPLTGSTNGWTWSFGPYAGVEGGVASGKMQIWGLPFDDTTDTGGGATPQTVVGTYDDEDADGEVLFDVNSSVIQADAVALLEQMCCDHLAAFMSPYGYLELDGHTSATGPDTVNDPLSVRRARSVAEAVRLLLGRRLLVPEERIYIVGRGESEAPGGPDGPEVGSARKVELNLATKVKVSY